MPSPPGDRFQRGRGSALHHATTIPVALRAPHLRYAHDYLREGYRTPLPAAARVALIRRPGDRTDRPAIYPDVAALAATLLRDRKGAALQLADAPLMLDREAVARKGVSVWTLEGGERRDYLGWAYVGGAGWRVLSAAIFALNPAPEAEAA